MEYFDEIKLFFHNNKTNIMILFIIFILMIYSIISENIYLIIVNVELFIICLLEFILKQINLALLGEKKLLELFITSFLFIIIFIVGYPLLDSNIDNSIYNIFIILYINWYIFTNILINFILKNDLKHNQSLNIN